MEKRILTIQDISCVGQCSLTVALPIISACGIETAILPTAVLSTHTAGFKGFTVLPMTDEFSKIAKHWKKENIAFDCVYTGYILKDQMQIVDEIIKNFNKGLKIVDPVQTTLEIKLNVANRNTAKMVYNKWEDKAAQIYGYLHEELID